MAAAAWQQCAFCSLSIVSLSKQATFDEGELTTTPRCRSTDAPSSKSMVRKLAGHAVVLQASRHQVSQACAQLHEIPQVCPTGIYASWIRWYALPRLWTAAGCTVDAHRLLQMPSI